MRRIVLALVALAASPPAAQEARACDAPVCVVSRESLGLTRILTFEDVPNSMGVGRTIDIPLVRDGARIGERFAGQTLESEGDYDRIAGQALAPLAVIAGQPGQNLGAIRLPGTVVLIGLGPRGHPRVDAIGEGAIAVLFDHDQGALALDLRGGETGQASILFLRRDGSTIHSLHLGPLGEDGYGFRRNAQEADIAGILILNSDPQGIAIDNLAFDDPRPSG